MKILILEDDGQTTKRMPQFKQRILELNRILNDKGLEGVYMTHVETAKECIEILKKEKFDLIFLDHDLGGKVYVDTNREDTGSEVARWINSNQTQIGNTKVIVHSFNSVGGKYMTDLIPNSLYVPGLWTKNIFHQVIKIN